MKHKTDFLASLYAMSALSVMEDIGSKLSDTIYNKDSRSKLPLTKKQRKARVKSKLARKARKNNK